MAKYTYLPTYLGKTHKYFFLRLKFGPEGPKSGPKLGSLPIFQV